MFQTYNNYQKLLCVIIDGFGINHSFLAGNAYHHAWTPNLEYLKKHHHYLEIYAHGQHVGLSSNTHIGNSEVGHLTLGAGNIYSQGAKKVHQAINSKIAFESKSWIEMISYVKKTKGTLHFLGLLSDGNVHSNYHHLFEMLEQACQCNITNIRIHALFDGRDVNDYSAEFYLNSLTDVINKLTSNYQADIQLASGGGRMHITMDRYQSDWDMVKRGWEHHVLGKGPIFEDGRQALNTLRKNSPNNDQFLQGFVIGKNNKPCGEIVDGDAVVNFNFRSDRMVQISQAFVEDEFKYFDRLRHPKIYYLGMCSYHRNNNIPKNYLIAEDPILNPLSKTLVEHRIRQFACSETHKFGHVVYYWNGRRSEYFDHQLEEYLEIPSLGERSDLVPWMQADKITCETIKRIADNRFDFARINLANGDMVGHGGDLDSAVVAMSVVDLMIGRLIRACEQYKTILMITADHGNCEEMFNHSDQKSFKDVIQSYNPITGYQALTKTAHTPNKVPFYLYFPTNIFSNVKFDTSIKNPGLGNIAGTILTLMGLKDKKNLYLPPLVILED